MFYFVNVNKETNELIADIETNHPSLIVLRMDSFFMLREDDIFYNLFKLQSSVVTITTPSINERSDDLSLVRRAYTTLLSRYKASGSCTDQEIIDIAKMHPVLACIYCIRTRTRWEYNEESLIRQLVKNSPTMVREYIRNVDMSSGRFARGAEVAISQSTHSSINTDYAIALYKAGIDCSEEIEQVHTSIEQSTAFYVGIGEYSEVFEKSFTKDDIRHAVYYAENLKRRIPHLERLIITDQNFCKRYIQSLISNIDSVDVDDFINGSKIKPKDALDIILKSGVRLPQLEAIISTSGIVSYTYANNVIKAPFPMAEKLIFDSAKRFVKYCIRPNVRREEYEHKFMNSQAFTAYKEHFGI